MTTVYVTGAGGFIGSRFVQMARDEGWLVYGADKKPEPLTGDRDKYITWDCDVADFKQYQDSLLRTGGVIDAVVHLAGTASTPRSLKAPYGVFRDNVMTAATVLQAAQVLNLPVVMTSSVKARDGLTPYGAAKVMVETWSESTRDNFELPVVINRPGTIYGKGQAGSPESGWIAWFLEAQKRGQTVTIDGDGLQCRDLLHVDDYCELLMTQVLDPERFSGAIWDVGGGHRNVVTVIGMARHLGLEFDHGPDRKGDAREYIGINDVPGWDPRIHWKAALEELSDD